MNVQATGKPTTMGEAGVLTDHPVETRSTTFTLIGAAIATVALALLIVLAFSTEARPTQADRIALLGLAVLTAICFWTPLYRWAEAQHGVATFALTAAMFIVYGLARQVTPPDDRGALKFASLPEDVFAVSYAAYIVVAGALLTAPFWLRSLYGWTKSVLLVLGIITVLGFGSFKFLSGYYTVGVTEVLDPTPLVHLGMQVIEFGSLALLCNAVCAHGGMRRWVLRALPLILLALWARHQFGPAPVEEEE